MPRLAVVILCLLLSVTACTQAQPEREHILRVMRLRAQALNARDLALYLSLISPAYNDGGKTFAGLRDGLEAGFKTYDTVSYRAEEQKVEIRGQRAEVTGGYCMKVVIRGHEMALEGRERITLAREPGGWKIVGGL